MLNFHHTCRGQLDCRSTFQPTHSHTNQNERQNTIPVRVQHTKYASPKSYCNAAILLCQSAGIFHARSEWKSDLLVFMFLHLPVPSVLPELSQRTGGGGACGRSGLLGHLLASGGTQLLGHYLGVGCYYLYC